MKKAAGSSLHRAYSSQLVDGADRAASRAMLHAVGFSKDDFSKSQIGIASTWSMVTPCNMHIDKLAVEASIGVNEAGGKGVTDWRRDGYLVKRRDGKRFSITQSSGCRRL